MPVVVLVLSVLLSIFSTAVMSYIAMATPIGPWIDSTLVLIAMLAFRLLRYKKNISEQVALVTCAGAVGGILATAMGFTFPTLYFIDPDLFASWMARPWFFCCVVTALAFVGGWFGIWVANLVEHKCIVTDRLAYPIGQLLHKMIAAHNQVRKAWELVIGFIATSFFCFLQDGVGLFKGFIPKTIALNKKITLSVFQLPSIPFDIWPMLWAVGFVTGHIIAVPLAVGALVRIFVVEPVNHTLFPTTSNIEFTLAFCSGMVLAGAIQSLLDTPALLWGAVKKITSSSSDRPSRGFVYYAQYLTTGAGLESLLLGSTLIAFFTYFKFSWMTQLYLVVFCFICTYQIVDIAGKIGLAQMGRFATFVMVPAMFLFKLNFIQIVFIAAFVELSGGVAADILFGRKMAYLSDISSTTVKKFQYFGLIISSLTIGIIFWLLINHFKLGSDTLFAQRAQGRQLLIEVESFDYYILLVGLIFGILLKYIKMNPMMVLSGLLMPLNISIGLIIGGFGSMLTKNREEWYPFWSGVFASSSVWMLIKAIL